MLLLGKEAQVPNPNTNDDVPEDAGMLAATIVALIVLVAVIVLFLVLKFQPFSGTTGTQLPRTR
jgi:hypothetical protein